MASGRSRDAAVDLEVALVVSVALLCMVALPLTQVCSTPLTSEQNSGSEV
jgi:hypothetical protein